MSQGSESSGGNPDLEVWIDQDLCTGDGLCVQYARDVFELDLDGLAYVKADRNADLETAPGARVRVPLPLLTEVLDSAKECPGECIHVVRADDGTAVAGPLAQSPDSAVTAGVE